MEIKFDVYFKRNLGTLCKDNEVDLDGKEAYINLDLNLVERLEANYIVGTTKYTDEVTIKDVENKEILIPFKSDVVKTGLNEFEIVAYMKNGDIKVSQTYIYKIEKGIGEGSQAGSGGVGDGHTHLNLTILNSITQAKVDEWDNKSDKEHTHDEYANKNDVYSIAQTDNKIREEISKIELKEGPKGDKGEQGEVGPQGPKGDKGADGVTTSIVVNGNTYTHVDGVITLPNYPTSVTGGSNNAIDILIEDAGNNFVAENVEDALSEVSSQIKEIVNNGNATLNKIEVLEEDPTDNLYEGRIWIYKQPDLSCTSITLDQTNIELTADNKTVTLVATVEPSNTIDNITWSSSEPEVATVLNGLVTAKSNGNTIITASCGSQSATCNIAVSGFVVQEVSNLVLSLSGSDFTNSPQTTTLPDNSGNNNDVTASGFDYTSTSGADGNNIVFDGTNDKLSIARNNMSLNISNGFTIIFKGKINDLSQTNKDIVDMNMKKWDFGSPGQQISLIYGYVANTIELYGDGLAFREGSQITMPDNGTHTIIYSYDGSTIKGYLDGSEVLSISRAISITLPIVELGIGGNVPSNSSQSYANITLNNFLLYNKGLTLDEITTICDNLG